MPGLRSQLLKIQRSVFNRNLRRIKEMLAYDAHLQRYSKQYYRNLRHYDSVSTKADLIRRIITSDVVYHGDYHTLKQSQRSVLRILREIVEKRPVILCLEMFHGVDQRFLDQYMYKEITRKEFHKKINYSKTWGFKWEHWKPVIDMCKKRKIPVYGINSTSTRDSLKNRDVYSSKIIGRLIIRHPDALVYVVDGDYHIAPSHLPSQVDKKLAEFDIEVKRTIIYQNSANLYWQLAHDRKEDASIVQVNEESFCLMNTTPANKLQSYLNWLDYSDDAYHPVQEEWEDSPQQTGSTSVPEMVRRICNILELPYPEEEIQNLEVYYGSNLEFMGILNKRPELATLIPLVKQKIKRSEGFFIEYFRDGIDAYLIYLPTSSINIAAEEATHFLNALLRRRQHGKSKPFDQFYSMVMTEAIGFFGSKLINDRRKVQTRHACRKFMGSFKTKKPNREEREKIDLCSLILKHRYLENISKKPHDFTKKFSDLYKTRSPIRGTLATQLGYMLGDKLFYAVKKRRFPLKEIIDLFNDPFDKPLSAFTTYMDISTRLARLRGQKKSQPHL